MILTYIIDIDGTLKLTQCQGHKVKGQGHIAIYLKNSLGYNTWTDGWILLKLTSFIDIDETLKLTQGQGHKVKGQGHIGIYVKK